MRLPTFERDFWALYSGEESHAANPDKFWIPPIEQRRALERGKAARLMFAIEGEEEDGKIVVQVERMWVIVAERVGDQYIVILDSKPASFEPSDTSYLCLGAEIPFGPEHVIDILEPPQAYVHWQLGQAPERIWPREGGDATAK